jgi:hypothetical protein
VHARADIFVYVCMCIYPPYPLSTHTLHKAEDSLKQREAARGMEERWQQQLAREAADARREVKALGEAVGEDLGGSVAVIRCVVVDVCVCMCVYVCVSGDRYRYRYRYYIYTCAASSPIHTHAQQGAGGAQGGAAGGAPRS